MIWVSKYLLFNEEIMFIKPQSPKQNRVDTYEAPVFAPDYSTTVLVAKIYTDHHEHSI